MTATTTAAPSTPVLLRPFTVNRAGLVLLALIIADRARSVTAQPFTVDVPVLIVGLFYVAFVVVAVSVFASWSRRWTIAVALAPGLAYVPYTMWAVSNFSFDAIPVGELMWVAISPPLSWGRIPHGDA